MTLTPGNMYENIYGVRPKPNKKSVAYKLSHTGPSRYVDENPYHQYTQQELDKPYDALHYAQIQSHKKETSLFDAATKRKAGDLMAELGRKAWTEQKLTGYRKPNAKEYAAEIKRAFKQERSEWETPSKKAAMKRARIIAGALKIPTYQSIKHGETEGAQQRRLKATAEYNKTKLTSDKSYNINKLNIAKAQDTRDINEKAGAQGVLHSGLAQVKMNDYMANYNNELANLNKSMDAETFNIDRNLKEDIMKANRQRDNSWADLEDEQTKYKMNLKMKQIAERLAAMKRNGA